MGSKKKGQGTFIKEVRFEKYGKFNKRLGPIRNFSDTSQRLQVLQSLGNNCALRPELYHNSRFNFFLFRKNCHKNPTCFLFFCHLHFYSWEPQKTGKQWWLKTRWEFLLSNFLIFYKYKHWQYNTNTNIRNSGSTCSIVEIGSKNEIKRQGLITTSHLPQIVNEGKVITW